MIDGIKIFDNELKQIKDETVRKWTEDLIKIIPEEFYVSPPSKTGRYHPPDEFCEMGSVIHSKRTFYAMKIICDSHMHDMSKEEISICLSAALLHDCCVHLGRSHAEEVRPLILKNYGQAFIDICPAILDLIESHMGRWGKKYPYDRDAMLVHLADNIAAKAHDIMDAGKTDKILEIPYYDTP